MKKITCLLVGCLAAAAVVAAPWSGPLPSFEATSLTGKVVKASELIGQPTVLIVTPSKAAAADTRQWAEALRKNLDEKAVRIRDVLAIDLPFFMSEADAIGRAREKIPARYHDQTWLYAKSKLEQSLGIPDDSDRAFVFVLDSSGKVLTQVDGAPTAERVEAVRSAVRAMK